MLIKVDCTECKVNKKEATHYLELTDEIHYPFVCDNGHGKNIILQERKFEILFEHGAIALMEGFTREAVSSFAAALERFYEFVVFMLLLHNNVDWVEIEKMWKYLENQSERQLGAFNSAYLMHFKSSPPIIDDKRYMITAFGKKVKVSEFRNNVIHKGRIPKYEEVLAYGEVIKRYISEILKLIYTDEYKDTHLRMTERTRRTLKYDEKPIVIYSLPTILKWTIPENLNITSLEEEMEIRRKYKEYWVIRPSPN